jgi:hypothetical protein
MLVHEVAEVFVIANGVRAGRTRPLAAAQWHAADRGRQLPGRRGAGGAHATYRRWLRIRGGHRLKLADQMTAPDQGAVRR